jgi:hypothetical protein
VLASEFQFLSAYTLEPLWELFDPPQEVLRPSDRITNPDTGELYWEDPYEVLLVPISYIISVLPLPYNLKTNTYYWGPDQYPPNHDGSY